MAVYYFGGFFVGRAAVLIDLGYFAKVLKFCFGEPRINYEHEYLYVRFPHASERWSIAMHAPNSPFFSTHIPSKSPKPK
jgi:hypothetical protein